MPRPVIHEERRVGIGGRTLTVRRVAVVECTDDEHDVIAVTGLLDPSVGGTAELNSEVIIPISPLDVLAGDIFAHLGTGIPFSNVNGTNATNPQLTYWDPYDPTAGEQITFEGLPNEWGSWAGSERDYAWAVNLLYPGYWAPEPATLALLSIGLMGLLSRKRRKRSS